MIKLKKVKIVPTELLKDSRGYNLYNQDNGYIFNDGLPTSKVAAYRRSMKGNYKKKTTNDDNKKPPVKGRAEFIREKDKTGNV
jgi:hypothetical protein